MINIKVGGITELKQLTQLDGLNIEFAGLDFYAESPWYMKDKLPVTELRSTDFDTKKVGVFLNAGFDEIMQTVEDYDLDVVQLNGEESPEFCEQLSETLEVIKAFNIDKNTSFEELIADFDEVCDYYQFTIASKKGAGSSGFDWKLFNKIKIEKPFFISDTIRPEDSAKVKSFVHPDFFGIHINSQFEKSAGVKDMVSILQFKKALKK
jgi:phosphoribosylanthranilate isomerase